MANPSETSLVSGSETQMDRQMEMLGTVAKWGAQPHPEGLLCSKWGCSLAGSSCFSRETENPDL